MNGVALALAASLAWGTSDFLGGLGARRTSLAVVLTGSQLAGLALFAPVLLLDGPPRPSATRMVPGLAAGVLAVTELGLLYLALRRGPTTVVAPIAALSAVLPVAVGMAHGDRVDGPIGIGIACALAGAVIVAWPGREQPTGGRGLLGAAALALAVAAATGGVLTLIGLASKSGPWWTVGSVHAGGALTATLLLGAAWAARRSRSRTEPRATSRRRGAAHGASRTAAAIIGVGLADLAADVAFANAARGSVLAVVAVLASLYPLVTIALGVTLLRERPSRIQLAGAALACTGVALLATPG